MFDDLMRTLRQLERGVEVSVPARFDEDADDYIDRACPGDDCKFSFKVHAEDWRNIVRDQEVFCPFCGHSAQAKSWLTTEQVEQVRKAALAQLKGRINSAMRHDAASWNRRQWPGSFIKITMQVSGAPQEVVLPAAATGPMRLKIKCAKCACRYSVIGSAFFCPSCGHNAAEHMFRQSLTTIRSTIAALAAIRQGLDDQDAAENTVRLVIESSLQGVVTAFQRFAEALFERCPTASTIKARRGAFQSLADGSKIWSRAYGRTYGDHLTADELARLTRYFQQRHVLAHRDGLVDADYLTRSGDTSYQPGQRLVIRETAVLDLVDLAEKLGAALTRDAV
jgi:hypothetical protein